MRTYYHTKKTVHNRGAAPDSFLEEMVDWARGLTESENQELFGVNDIPDIYNKVRAELGAATELVHRKAIMLEVLRVLAGFESSWNWNEGVDTSKKQANTSEAAEAGAWQISHDSRMICTALRSLLSEFNIWDGRKFQVVTKANHSFAMLYVITLLRHNTKHNGPLYKGAERKAIRESLRGPEHSIYPWLSKAAVSEFQSFLS